MTIAGAIYPDAIPEESATKRMLASSRYFPHHVWQEGRIELGSATKKPPESPCRVLFDGILYNLEALKQVVKGDSVEEIIAALFTLYQEKCFSLLSGSFTFTLYDEKKQELFLVRDRLGEKGLYWTLKNNLFLFANSLKSLLASRLISTTPDLEALSFYLSFGYIPQEKSPIQNVFKLQPGHYLKVTKEKNLLIRPYWAYNPLLKQKNVDLTEKDLEHAAERAWKQRITSSPLCYVQSEEEATLLQKSNNTLRCIQPSKTLSSEEVFADLYEMIWQLEEPVADISLPALWHTCKNLKSQNATELFFTTGSLPHLQREIHPPQLFFFKPFSFIERFLKERMLIPFFHRLHPSTAYEMLRSIHTHPWHIAFLNQSALFDHKEFDDLHSHLLKPVNNEIFLHRFPALEKLGPTISSLLYLYHKIKLPTASLLPQDRFCSHFGMVSKTPYLDVHMIELLAKVPDMSNGLCYAKLFTPTTSRVAPLPAWINTMTIQKMTEKLSKSVLVEAGLFSPSWLSEQMKNFNRHPHLFFQELWGLLVLEVWFRLFIEGGSPQNSRTRLQADSS